MMGCKAFGVYTSNYQYILRVDKLSCLRGGVYGSGNRGLYGSPLETEVINSKNGGCGGVDKSRVDKK